MLENGVREPLYGWRLVFGIFNTYVHGDVVRYCKAQFSALINQIRYVIPAYR